MKIRPKSVDWKTLKLSTEEGFVLSRVEGTTTVKELAALTGFDDGHVIGIVERLRAEGAIEIADGPPAPSDDTGDEELATPEPPETEANGSDALESSDPEADAREREGEQEHRKLYETAYHPMTRDARVKAAGEVSGAHLTALCFDADPQVVFGILSNAAAGLEQARYIAQHHRTQLGLDAVAKRAEFLSDALVQRRLLRNPQLPATILTRILNPKMMLEVYKVAIDREIPERTRTMTRETLRKKFTTASSDERAALLFKTEGRCLLHLTGASLDAHATQILCGKQNYTSMFVQNLARWSATPPALLAHLLKNPVVRRNLGLKKLLLRHPNMPSDAKRHA
jgi:hypothetical protein